VLIWRVIWAIVRKDLAVWLRQPSSIAATLLPAVGFFVLIYFSAQAVGRNPVALVVQDSGPRAQQLAGIIADSDAFLATPMSPAQAQAALQEVQVAAIVTIPPSFDAAYAAHRPDPVTIQINNLNLDFTNDLRRSLPAAITAFYAEQPESPIRVTVQETDLRPQDISLTQFDLVPNLVLLLTIAGVVNAGLATAREWEAATVKELLLAPVARANLIAGKLLAGWLTTMLVCGVVLALGAGTGFFHPVGIYWLVTLGMLALLALASVGLGVTLGALLQNLQRVSGVSIPLSFYLFFLSGGITVVAFLPPWVQTLAHLIPTYYGVHALEMAVFYGSSEQLGLDLAVVAATAAVAVSLGVVVLRRRTAG
jgi:ABC-2 type transport system permease protein